MQARTLPDLLRRTSILFVFLATGCVATSTPRIQACAAAGGSSASEGTLRILPSTVPGVEIDSAYWQTGAGTQDIGTWEALAYHSRLRASRPVRRSELAIVYDPHESSMVLDADVATARYDLAALNDPNLAHADLKAQDTTTTARVIHIDGGLQVGKWSAIRYCPRAVQLVARSELPFLLTPRLASDSVRSAAARSTAASQSPLVMVKDTLLQAGGLGGSTLGWAAINVADTTLTDMIVALVVVGPASLPDTGHRSVPAVEDTIEYHVGPVAARGRAGFVGGELRYREGIAERISYPAAHVSGRTIPGVGEVQRVSAARAVARERAVDNEREQARTADVLWTDSLQYVAQRGRGVSPGLYEYQLTIVVRYRNPMTVPLYLPRCVAGGGPAYAIVRLTTREERTAYTPDSSCAAGIRALRIDPDSARVDTLRMRIHHADRPDWEVVEGPRAEGMFHLAIDALTCDDGTPACHPPQQNRLSRSRPFTVRLGPM